MGNRKKRSIKKITPTEAKKRLDTERGIVLLDVRTSKEYVEKHIPGSILIPVDVLEREAASMLPDKETVIFTYCRTGRRSAEAANILEMLGYKNVYDMGGIMDWPYKTVSGL